MKFIRSHLVPIGMGAVLALSGGAWALSTAGASSPTSVLYVTALTPNGVTTPVSGSQGWYVDEPSGDPTNFGIQQVDSNVTDPSSAAAASLQQVVEGAADHVRALVPFTTPVPASALPGGLSAVTYRQLLGRGYPVSLQIAAFCDAATLTGYTSFVYEPATEPAGQWTSQDAIQGGNAQWWSTHSFAGYPGSSTDQVLVSWSSLMTTWAQACPGGELYSIGFNLGSSNPNSESWSNGLAFTDPQGSFLYNFGPAPTAAPESGTGYWMVASDGGIFNFGDAGFFQSMGGKHLNAPIVGVAGTPDHQGYWEVASDGGVFAFGDAQFYGSMGGRHLNQPIVGIVSSTDGKGYLLIAKDGGGFAFGDYVFNGSMGGKPLNAPVVGGSGF